MIDGNFALALTTGMLVTLNPCGFAMLPAYLGSFLGRQTAEDAKRGTVADIARALRVSVAVTLGFMVVFLVLGIAVNLGARWLYSVSQWLTVFIGLALLGIGIAMLFGYRLPVLTPKLNRGGKDGSFQSMFVFGVSYAVASLGCSLALFIGYSLSTAKTHGLASAFVSFLMYSLGFGLVLTVLTVSLALAQGWFLRGLRKVMQYIDRASAVLMILAGLYLAWYGYTEIRGTASTITLKATTWTGQAQTWIQDQGLKFALVLGVVVLAAMVAVVLRRRTPPAV